MQINYKPSGFATRNFIRTEDDGTHIEIMDRGAAPSVGCKAYIGESEARITSVETHVNGHVTVEITAK